MEEDDGALANSSIAAKKTGKSRNSSSSRTTSRASDGEVVVNGRLVQQLEEQSRKVDDDFADLWHDDPNLFRRDPRRRSVGGVGVESRVDNGSPWRPRSAGAGRQQQQQQPASPQQPRPHVPSELLHSPGSLRGSRRLSGASSPSSDVGGRAATGTRLEDHVETLTRKIAAKPSVAVQHQLETDAIKADLKRATKQAQELQRSLAKETKARATRDMSLERKTKRLEEEITAVRLHSKQDSSDLFELMARNKDLERLLKEMQKQMGEDHAYFLKVIADEKSARQDLQGLLELAESKLRKTENDLESKIDRQRATIERLKVSGQFYSADGELLDPGMLEVRCRELEEIVHDLQQERNSVAMEARSSLRTQFEQVLRRAKRAYEDLLEETNALAAEKVRLAYELVEDERQAKETQILIAQKFQQQFEDMRHTASALEVSIQRLQALYEKHTNEIRSLTAQNQQLREQLSQLDGDRATSETQFAAEKRQLETELEIARNELRIMKTELQGTIDSQATELAHKARFHDEASARIASLTEQLERARTDLEDAIAKRVNSEADSAYARQMKDKLLEDLRKSKNEEQAKLLEELGLFKSITTNYHSEVERLKAEVNELQAQNKALQEDKRVLLSLQQMDPAAVANESKPQASSSSNNGGGTWVAKQEQRFKMAARQSSYSSLYAPRPPSSTNTGGNTSSISGATTPNAASGYSTSRS